MKQVTRVALCLLALVGGAALLGTQTGTAQQTQNAEPSQTEDGAPALPTDAPETAESSDIANGQRFGSWRVTCEALGVNRTACVLTQRIARSSDNAFLADLLLFPQTREGEPVAALLARVPTGAHLPSGFVMRADPGETQYDLVWQTCGGRFCEALGVLEPDQIETLQDGENGVIAGYRPSVQTEPVFFRLDFDGAAEGLEALRQSAGNE